MLQNNQRLSSTGRGRSEDSISLKDSHVSGRLGGLNVVAGCYNALFADGNIMDSGVKGVELNYGNQLKLNAYVGRDDRDINNPRIPFLSKGKYMGVTTTYEVNDKLKLDSGYIKTKDWGNLNSSSGQKIYHLGAKYKAGNVNLSARYLYGAYRGAAKKMEEALRSKGVSGFSKSNGYVLSCDYKGVKASKPGSWGMFAKYYFQPGSTFINHETKAETFDVEDLRRNLSPFEPQTTLRGVNAGFKGFGIGASYALAKNTVAKLAYYDTKSIASYKGAKAKAKVLLSQLTFSF